MNRDDIIKLARAAAIKFAHWDDWDSNEPASGPNGNEPHEEREYWISVVEFIADVAYAAGAAAERKACSRVRAAKPRELRPVGTGALLAEQQYCFEKGHKEGAASVRAAIRARGQG